MMDYMFMHWLEISSKDKLKTAKVMKTELIGKTVVNMSGPLLSWTTSWPV